MIVQQSSKRNHETCVCRGNRKTKKKCPERYNCGVPGRLKIFTTRFHQVELSIQNLYNMRVIIIKTIIYTLGEATYLARLDAAEVIGMGELWGQTTWSPPYICYTM